jgi:hypothetical protein
MTTLPTWLELQDIARQYPAHADGREAFLRWEHELGRDDYADYFLDTMLEGLRKGQR